MVLEKLRDVDPVAYIRFATIYNNVKTVDEFEKMVKDFKKTNGGQE